MPPLYGRPSTLRAGCVRGGNSLKWIGGSCRRYAKKSPPPRSSPPPKPTPKPPPAIPKPLPFKPAKPKPTPKPASKPAPKPTPTPSPTPTPTPHSPASPPPPPKPLPASASSSSTSSSSKGYEDKRRPVSELVRNRWFPLFGAGAAAVCVGFFSVSMINYWRTHPAEQWLPGQEPETPTGRPTIQSPLEFDQHLDKSEWRFGITKLRRRIASEMARGHVLEVAVGAGRNFDYYDWSVVTEGLAPAEEKPKSGWFGWLSSGEEEEKKPDGKENTTGTEEKGKPTNPPPSQAKAKPQPANANAILSFTGVDISPPMLDLALTRIRQVVPHMADQIPKKPSFTLLATSTIDNNPGLSLANNRLRILKSDAQASLPAPPSPSSPSSPASQTPQKYDTILQTFGLCSVRDPVLLLSTMAHSLVPDTGRIVLLEHGRSWWELVNGLLDRSARGHFERFGCWWNRDIEVVVRTAERAVPGLEVVRLERPGWVTMGTHVLVEMRVRGDVAAAAAAAADAAAAQAPDVLDDGEKEKGQKTTGWWSSWMYMQRSQCHSVPTRCPIISL
ncbi:uncharacterized protein F4807DRAFT_431878 [Annulohypoxylon truncatum]|uniref:uncharacterized protein n=1 Tax=Annulohypoxylon truncatum TaxID=327061 RepID=UPI002008341D|nr:uncharacterized protein F4807DRAFT_431878 [Annulohypoxylon truncatum]KAI1208179.1 hypothetical protein F4807DRAFT_431878 [Annulohypoxylon truncatum]